MAGAQGIGALAGAVGGAGHGKGGLSAILRESVVVMRELVEGRGIGRVIGSLSILGQAAWKGFLGALISIPGLVAAGGAAIYYFTTQRVKKLNEALDKTAESMSHAIGDRARANTDAMMEAARAAGELKARIADLARVHETLAEKLDESLRKMEEEFQMMRKIAGLHGETPAQEMAAEQAMRKKQLDLVNQTLAQQKKLADEARKADEAANAAAFTSAGARGRNAQLKDQPGQLEDARQAVEKYLPIVTELQQKSADYENTLRTGGVDGPIDFAEIPALVAQFNSQQQITKNGEAYSLANAANLLRQNQDFVKSLPERMAQLEETQRQLSVAATKSAEGDTQAAKDVITLTKKRDELADQIGLHDRYDSRLGGAAQRGGGAGDLTANQRIGAWAPAMQPAFIDLQRQAVAKQDTTNQILNKILETSKSHTHTDIAGMVHEVINAPFQ